MIVIRDLRRKEKFQVDDEYLNGYAKLCGVYATAVYMCLCRHADYHTQSCFPSIENMAEKLDIGRESVKRGIKKLEQWGIIKKERTRHPTNAKWVNNSYVLLDKSVWAPKTYHGSNRAMGNHGSVSAKPRLYKVKSHSSVGASKDYTLKETYKKDTSNEDKIEEYKKNISDLVKNFNKK